jgi:transposase
MRQFSTLYVGWAVHQDSIAVASGAQEHGAEIISLGTMGPRQADIDQLTRQLHSQATPLVFVDEAGPCGSWLDRSVRHTGDACWGVAPSLLPKQAGDRLNPDRREARPWARRLRSGDLTPVCVPTVAAEVSRDPGRARAEAIRDLKAAPCRLKAFWLRHARRSTGRAPWSPAPLRWLSAVVCPTPGGMDHCGSKPHPKSSRISAGRHPCGCASAIARGSPAGNTRPRAWSRWPGNSSAAGGPGPQRCP